MLRTESSLIKVTRLHAETLREWRRMWLYREREVRVREQATRGLLVSSLTNGVGGAKIPGMRRRLAGLPAPIAPRPTPRGAAGWGHMDRAMPRRPHGLQPIALELRVGRNPVGVMLRPIGAKVRAALGEPPTVRPPELIWRNEVEERAAEAARSFTIGSAPAPAASRPAAGVPDWSASAAAAAQPPVPDPAWVDRIAEDVIGRVERRVRIERERRGV